MSDRFIFLTIIIALHSVGASGADPMRPPSWAVQTAKPEGKKEAAGYTLQQILISGDRAVAVINGQVVEEGDQVDGASVIAIRKDFIRLRNGGRNRTLRLVPDTKDVADDQ